MRIPRALAVGGSDPGGGAGIQADLKTFTALKTYGMAAVAALTVQDTRGVRQVAPVSPRLLARQVEAAAGDLGADALKTGMLATEGNVRAVAEVIRKLRLNNIVVDPVLKAKGGRSLLEKRALRALKEELLPQALLVTPNAPEAEALAGLRIRGPADAERAAVRIAALGPRAVLVKGGHLPPAGGRLPGASCADLLYHDGRFEVFEAPRVATSDTHGTGCTLAAAVAAYLARGLGLREAVRLAKAYVTGAVRSSLRLGSGRGPLCHYWKVR